eukprot:6186679-Pleurochrysis_carterae.AAC.1
MCLGGRVCQRVAPACVPAAHQDGAHRSGRTSGGTGSPPAVCQSCARAMSCYRQQPLSGEASRWRSGRPVTWSTPSTPRQHHRARASRALAPAVCACGARLGSVTARSRSFLKHETDLGAVEYDLIVAVERAAGKVAATVALVAHKVGAQRAVGNLFLLDAINPTSLVARCMSRNGAP